MKPSLSTKLTLLIILMLLVDTLLILRHSEEELESAILDQVRTQTRIFLEGVAREVGWLPYPWRGSELDEVLRSALAHLSRQDHLFAAKEIYVFDGQGRILGHTEPGPHPDRDLEGYYRDVLRTGKPYLGLEVDQDDNEGAVVDVIVPLRQEGHVVAGLEAELDLDRTMAAIKATDNAYEQELLLMQSLHAVVLFFLLWWVNRRLLLKPIALLDRVTRAISGGDLKSRVTGPLSSDELGSLGGSINEMAENIERLVEEQEEAYLGTLRSLTQALETKDAYTATHSSRVAHFSVMLGRHLGLPEEKLEMLRKGALMHDLGKIGIPDAVLNKPGPLSDHEFEEMKRHPVNTAAIMRPLNRFKEFAEIAAWHHERWDGKGYPDGLAGEEIPLLARIVSVADTWDAMTGDRVYRKGMPREKALSILEHEREQGQWDPRLVAAFLEMIRTEEG